MDSKIHEEIYKNIIKISSLNIKLFFKKMQL